jgi:hypothetical protein
LRLGSAHVSRTLLKLVEVLTQEQKDGG